MTLVRLEHKQKQYSRAEELLRRLDKIEPGNASVLYALANISALQGKKNIAVTWLEKSAAASDSVLEPRVVLAKYYLERVISQGLERLYLRPRQLRLDVPMCGIPIACS